MNPQLNLLNHLVLVLLYIHLVLPMISMQYELHQLLPMHCPLLPLMVKLQRQGQVRELYM